MARHNDKDERPKQKSPRTRKQRNRRKAIALYVTAAVVLAASYPLGTYAFDKMIESDYSYTLIPDKVISLIPSDLVEKITSKLSDIKNGSLFNSSPAADSSAASSQAAASLDTGSLDSSISSDPNVLAETTPVSDTYLSSSLFLGDYLSTPLREYELVPDANVFAQNDVTPQNYLSAVFTDSSTGASESAAEVASSRTPERFYIALGSNGAAQADDSYYQAFRTLIETIKAQSPSSSIVLESLYPVSASPGSGSALTNTIINDVNKQLLSIAREENIYYLDINSGLKDSSGVMDPSYDSGDGIHYNKAGYTAIMNYIKSHAVPTS